MEMASEAPVLGRYISDRCGGEIEGEWVASAGRGMDPEGEKEGGWRRRMRWMDGTSHRIHGSV